jgi:pSer/pThr/pTyr-binding forkhead associated (FHA) protein/DNA-directed RNA polymerase subunit RPC12/RpoP
MEQLISGTLAGTGSFRCEQCGHVLTLTAADALSDCPGCGGQAFVRASLFTAAPVETSSPDAAAERTSVIAEARSRIDAPGDYLVYTLDGHTAIVPLTRDGTRIGRSLAANIRFDDPTVSRRHALIVRDGSLLRVLDDRSLNGVFVNGKRVESSLLTEGDEIVVGRHRLHFIAVSSTAAATEPTTASA